MTGYSVLTHIHIQNSTRKQEFGVKPITFYTHFCTHKFTWRWIFNTVSTDRRSLFWPDIFRCPELKCPQAVGFFKLFGRHFLSARSVVSRECSFSRKILKYLGSTPRYFSIFAEIVLSVNTAPTKKVITIWLLKEAVYIRATYTEFVRFREKDQVIDITYKFT